MVKPGRLRKRSEARIRNRGGLLPALAIATTVLVGTSLLQPLTAGATLPKDANPNGVLTYGIDLNNEFDNTFDPEQSFNPCGFAILSNIYASGLAITNSAFLPNVITSWSTTPNTVTLHLRPGVVFSNGDPVDANAIKTSLLYSRQSPLLTTLTAISTIDVINSTDSRAQPVEPHSRRRRPGDVPLGRHHLRSQHHQHGRQSAGRSRAIRLEELQRGVLHQARRQPQVLQEGPVPARRRRFRPGIRWPSDRLGTRVRRHRHGVARARRGGSGRGASPTSQRWWASPTTTSTCRCGRTPPPSTTRKSARRWSMRSTATPSTGWSTTAWASRPTNRSRRGPRATTRQWGTSTPISRRKPRPC